jgi:hypothetical protein
LDLELVPTAAIQGYLGLIILKVRKLRGIRAGWMKLFVRKRGGTSSG